MGLIAPDRMQWTPWYWTKSIRERTEKTMFAVRADSAIFEKLGTLLQGQEPGTCIRIREYTLGGG